MEEEFSRREFFKREIESTLKAVGTSLAISLPIALLVGGPVCYLDMRDRKKPPKNHLTSYELFNGDVIVTRTEITQREFFSDLISSVKFDFDIKKSGNYLFEGWAARYRARDTKEEEWKFKESETPGKFTKNLNSLIYRVEAVRSNEGGIDKDSIVLASYNGKPIVSGILDQGHQIW